MNMFMSIDGTKERKSRSEQSDYMPLLQNVPSNENEIEGSEAKQHPPSAELRLKNPVRLKDRNDHYNRPPTSAPGIPLKTWRYNELSEYIRTLMANSLPVYVLITGVSPGGLGDALTSELLKRPNIHVLASALETTHLSHLPKHDRISRLQLDVTSPSSISAAVAAVASIANGRLHYLINNAGYGYMMPLLDAEAQAVKQNFEVNVFGLLAVTQAFFPLLRESKGTVVNQCSIASLAGGRQPYIGTYCATKAAVASLNDTMRVEFAPFGVKVIYIF